MPFDKSPSPSHPRPAIWQESLRGGDVLQFPLPVQNADRSRDSKPASYLVLDVFERGRSRYAMMARGTSENVTSERAYVVDVREPEARRMAGLDQPTRFNCARTVLLRLDHAGFKPNTNTGSPVIGQLDYALTARMNAVRARLQAEADIAADAREERRREELRWRREGAGFPERNRALRGAIATFEKGYTR